MEKSEGMQNENQPQEIECQEQDCGNDDVAEIKKTREDQSEEIQNLKNAYKNLQLESKRIQKRMNEQIDTQEQKTREDTIVEMLEVIDDIEHAWKASSEQKTIQHGIELIYRKFLDKLSSFGVYQIRDVNVPFDALIHEAVQAVSQSNTQPNIVLGLHRIGYRTQDRTLRAAQVIVSK